MSLQAREIPGIKIFRSSTTVYYTNAEMYMEALTEKVGGCRWLSSSVDPSAGLFHSSSFSRSFVQSGIEIGKLLSAKKKRNEQMKRDLEKEKKKAKKEKQKHVRPRSTPPGAAD